MTVPIGTLRHANHGDENLLIWRQLIHAPAHGCEREPPFGNRAAIFTHESYSLIDVERRAPDLFGPLAVKPEVLRDAIHPTLELRSRLPLIKSRERTLAGVLNEVVCLIHVSRERECEPAQARQERDHSSPYIFRHGMPSPRRVAIRTRLLLGYSIPRAIKQR